MATFHFSISMESVYIAFLSIDLQYRCWNWFHQIKEKITLFVLYMISNTNILVHVSIVNIKTKQSKNFKTTGDASLKTSLQKSPKKLGNWKKTWFSIQGEYFFCMTTFSHRIYILGSREFGCNSNQPLILVFPGRIAFFYL